jgi:acyl-CoA synthetase (AMP-forming)/AMP-acid ligase II
VTNICPNKSTVHECIEYYSDQNPDALCCSIRVDSNWLPYSRKEFWNYVCRYAAAFRHSLSEPTLILFIKKLDIHLLAAYIGAMKAGHLPAQISFPSSKVNEVEYRKKMNHVHDITRFGALFTDSLDKGLYSDIKHVRVFTSDSLNESFIDKEDFRSEDALVQFSSGSTGLQKGVLLTHRGIVAHMQNYATTLQLNSEDAIATWLPLYHDMGLIACYLMPLMCGIPFYQIDPFDWVMQPDILLKVIEEKRPTVCFLPNFAYNVLANKGHARDLSSIRLWINCSEPARLLTHMKFLHKFPSVSPDTLTVCYALAENTFAVSQTFPWHKNSTRPHENRNILSCGKPIPGVDIIIINKDHHGEGEVGIKSPSLLKQFMDGTRPLQDGFYLTGDLGFMDETGELFITGRKKDVIIVRGKNIYPEDVEFAVSEVTGVYPGRTVAFGIWYEDVGSEELIVLAEKKKEAEPTPLKIAIQKAVQDEIGIVPKRVEILEHMSLVKTSSGKISRSRNKEIYLAKGLTLL